MTSVIETFVYSAFISGLVIAALLYLYYSRKVKRAEADEIPFRRLGKLTVVFSIVLILVLTPLSIGPERNPDPEKVTYNGATALEGWREVIDHNCMDCHTIVGNGAFFAPELKYIAINAQKGDVISARLRAFAGTKFMPIRLGGDEITRLTAWMLYLKDVDTNNWPPMKMNDYSFESSFDRSQIRWYESFDAWIVYWILTTVFAAFLLFGLFYWYSKG
jgi:nitric oxide reductase subunit C